MRITYVVQSFGESIK